MNTNTVNISFQKKLLSQIDQIAREESRSRSELIREAARIYIERKNRWKDIFHYGETMAKKIALTETDIQNEINRYRRLKKAVK